MTEELEPYLSAEQLWVMITKRDERIKELEQTIEWLQNEIKTKDDIMSDIYVALEQNRDAR